MLKKMILAGIVVALMATAFTAQAGHDTREGGYFTAVVKGDHSTTCGVGGLEEGDDPILDLEEVLGFCLGGYIFTDLDAGNWRLEAEDDVNDIVSGAYRIEPGGETVDICLDGSGSADGVPSDATIALWVDGVVFWALGQPCGLGVLSQGTFGTATATHL